MNKDESDVTSDNGTPATPPSGDDTAVVGDPFADVEEIDGELDDDFLPRPKQRLGAISIALIAVLIAGLGFLGGVVTQKHSASGTTTAGGFGGGRGAAARQGGFGGGTGFGGFGTGGTGGTGGAGSGGTQAGSGTSGDSSSSSDSSTPAVIGTLVSVTGDTAVVRNLAGKEITVHLSDDTTVSSRITAADLKAGQTVTIAGSTATDGSVTATSVSAK